MKMHNKGTSKKGSYFQKVQLVQLCSQIVFRFLFWGGGVLKICISLKTL